MSLRTVSRACMTASLLTVLVLAAGASPVSAQGRAQAGVRIGANFDYDDVFLGGHLAAPISSRLDIYPSFDIYFPDSGSRFALSLDLRVRFPSTSDLQFYAGGGMNYLHRSEGDTDHGDVGGDLLGGFDARLGRVRPFVEGKILLHDDTSFQILAGLNFPLGR